ncbi:MAG: formate dehydrogenase beta subunit [Lautropia sp.]
MNPRRANLRRANPRRANPRVYVPADAAALAVDADGVADAIRCEAARRGVTLEIVRNGSRGMFWLEPFVEIEPASDAPAGGARIGYGPVTAADVPALFDAGWLAGGASPLSHGPVDAMPYLARQQRIVFARAGLADPLSLADYEAAGGWAGLRRALTMTPQACIDEVIESGLRGRGGAAFPTGVKWRTVLDAPVRPAGAMGDAAGTDRLAPGKYVVCNADEGDSGTFSDRMLMEGDPYALIEGMTIAALAVGATRGHVYVRSEYPEAIDAMREAVRRATAAGFLGATVLGSDRRFELSVAKAAGSYVCGEETALLESLEGRRGIVRAKPPLPAIEGLFGQPTVINNVITFASVPPILAHGASRFGALGTGRSRGTLPFQLAGNVKRGGLVELAFGASLRELVEDFGGGTASGRPVKAIQVGGPLGTYVPPARWDTPLDYEAYAAFGGVLGHGGIIVHDDTADLAALARYAMAFCAIESCGKCTPCRIGAVRGVEVIDRIRDADTDAARRREQVVLLRDLCDTMQHASLCAMGGMTPFPVRSALDHYPKDFGL